MPAGVPGSLCGITPRLSRRQKNERELHSRFDGRRHWRTLYLARDGQVWVCAGGATNTNGKGGPVAVSREHCSSRQHEHVCAVGVEIANNGVGEPWPQVQVDAAFAVSLAITSWLGLVATDALGHVDWSQVERSTLRQRTPYRDPGDRVRSTRLGPGTSTTYIANW